MPIEFKISADQGKSWMDAVSITAFDAANGIVYMFNPNDFARLIRWDHKEMIIEFTEEGEIMYSLALIDEFVQQYLQSFLPKHNVASGFYILSMGSDEPLQISIEATKDNDLAGMPLYKHDLN